MAIRILEFNRIPNGSIPVRPGVATAQTPGTVGASSVQSAAFGASTNLVTVQADEACHVVFGGDPTATTSGFLIAAGGTEDFGVSPGDKVAWIQA